MEALETIMSQLLEEDNFWVQKSIKVNLTKREKIKIGKPTTPRPEIDLIAYNQKANTLYLLEVKSYLDSLGVQIKDLKATNDTQKGRYKLLTSRKYRETVSKRLSKDLIAKGLINKRTKISYGLIAGHVYRNQEQELKALIEKKKWLFIGPSEIKEKIIKLAGKGYENNEITIATKILLRKYRK